MQDIIINQGKFNLWCFLFRQWKLHLVRGDYGEPGEERCKNCQLTRARYDFTCYCLGNCVCEYPIFVGINEEEIIT